MNIITMRELFSDIDETTRCKVVARIRSLLSHGADIHLVTDDSDLIFAIVSPQRMKNLLHNRPGLLEEIHDRLENDEIVD